LKDFDESVLLKFIIGISYPMGTRGSFPGGKAADAWNRPLTSI